MLLGSGKKLAPGGVFVSSGALGVGLGTLAGKAGASFLLPGCLLATALLLQLFTAEKDTVPESERCAVRIAAVRPFWIVLGLALTSVVIRAWAGGEIPMDWKTNALTLAPSVASCAGKALGGFAADRFGARRVGTAALLCAAPLLCFGSDNAVLSLPGIVLFNFTMPVSLGTVASLLPDTPGLAFGLTTLALLLGSMPQLFWKPSGMTAAMVVAGMTLLSAGCVIASVKKRERGRAL